MPVWSRTRSGMQHIFCHPLAGVLSAYGMGLADQSVMREAALERLLDEQGLAEARELAARLEKRGGGRNSRFRGSPRSVVRIMAARSVRYHGTDTALACELPADSPAQAAGGRDSRGSSSAPIAAASRS